MSEDYTIEEGRWGKILVARSGWDNRFFETISSQDIRELELNYAKGFVGKDLSFLQHLPFLRVLLLTHRTIEDISPIHHLRNLIVLEVNTYCRTQIDFSRFTLLEECVLEWRPKATSLFNCTMLRKLFLNSYTGKSTDSFAALVNLEYLGLANASVVDLKGLSTLRALRFLGLYNPKKLESLIGIEPLSSLEHLEVNGCKRMRSIEPVAELTQLKNLHFCDDGHIESLRPIANLNKLEEVLFYGSTNILDGDLSPLIDLPHLRKVSFEERLHYSLSRSEIQERAQGYDRLDDQNAL